MADITENIEKQMAGTNLALAAVAEVLQKMDARLVKEESDNAYLAKAQADASAKSELVKAIANEVIDSIKNEGFGMPVSGDVRAAGGNTGSSGDADDSEKDADIITNIEAQQNTLQAARLRKQKNDEDEEEEEELVMAKQEDEEEEDAADEAVDVPVELGYDEDDEEDEEDEDEMKSMRKQIRKLQKALENNTQNIQKSIKTESEERLRKMGFREETGLRAPKLANGLGVENTPIVKSASADVTEQLVNLSYKELRDLQTKIETGDTDGVPIELIS